MTILTSLGVEEQYLMIDMQKPSNSGRRIRKCLLHTLSGVMVIFTLVLPWSASAAGREVLVLISQDKPIYRAVLGAIKTELQASAANRVRLSAIYLDDVDNAEISKQVPELVVTIGSTAMEASAASFPDTPTIVLFVPKVRFERLYPNAFLPSGPVAKSTPGVVVLDQPIMRQIMLARHLVPEGKVGLVLGPNTHYFQTYLEEYQPELIKHLVIDNVWSRLNVNDSSDIVSTAKSVITEADILVAVPDSLVWSPESAKWLLYLAYQKHKPVVGFSAALSRAGAVVSMFSEPAQIGKQGGEKIVQWLNEDNSWKVASSPKYFRYEVNHNVAASFGWDAQRLAADLMGKVK